MEVIINADEMKTMTMSMIKIPLMMIPQNLLGHLSINNLDINIVKPTKENLVRRITMWTTTTIMAMIMWILAHEQAGASEGTKMGWGKLQSRRRGPQSGMELGEARRLSDDGYETKRHPIKEAIRSYETITNDLPDINSDVVSHFRPIWQVRFIISFHFEARTFVYQLILILNDIVHAATCCAVNDFKVAQHRKSLPRLG
jgi:hypothetical protein